MALTTACIRLFKVVWSAEIIEFYIFSIRKLPIYQMVSDSEICVIYPGKSGFVSRNLSATTLYPTFSFNSGIYYKALFFTNNL